jgi:hypothetical protein
MESAMGELDTSTYLDAARSYTQLRRRYWRFFLGMPALALLLYLGAIISAVRLERNSIVPGKNPIATVLTVLFVVAWLTSWLGSFATGIALKRFRCPRCGKRFTLAWWGSWPGNRCKHCDLDLGPSAIAAAKPPVQVDPLE